MLKKYTLKPTKTMPVLLLLDTSTSMRGSKIRNLNKAVRQMIQDMKNAQQMEEDIQVGVVTFGPASTYLPFTPVEQIEWQDLSAKGWTPVGDAINLARSMLDDEAALPQRLCTPTVVLLSDGQSTDHGMWVSALENFKSSGRSAKSDRMAVAVGDDADMDMLSAFCQGCGHEVFRTDGEGLRLLDVFKTMTMVMTTRGQTKKTTMANGACFDI